MARLASHCWTQVVRYFVTFLGPQIMGAISKIFVYTLTLIFFTTFAVADNAIWPQPSVGCTIFSTGERETKHICNETEASLERDSGLLVLTLKRDGSSIVQKIILEDEELQLSSLEELRSAIWTIQNCRAEDVCSKPTHEMVSQIALHQCDKEAKKYTLYRGFFLLDQPPLKTSEIGTALVCASHQKLSALISAELFATGKDIFILLPISTANGEE